MGSSEGATVSGAAAASATAGFSRGSTGAGSSIFGGFSSTLGGVLCSALGLGLKKSPTRAERRRPTLAFFSSFFSSFLRVISQDITFGDVGFTAYLLFLGGLGLRSGLSGRLSGRCLGGSGGLTKECCQRSHSGRKCHIMTHVSFTGSAGVSSALGASAGVSVAGSLGASSAAGAAAAYEDV